MVVKLWRLNPLVGSNGGASTKKIGLEIVQLLVLSNGSDSQTYVPTLSYIIQSSPEDDAEMVRWMVMVVRVC